MAGPGQYWSQAELERGSRLAAAGDEQERLTVADDVVRKGDVVDLDLGHGSSSGLVGAGGGAGLSGRIH